MEKNIFPQLFLLLFFLLFPWSAIFFLYIQPHKSFLPVHPPPICYWLAGCFKFRIGPISSCCLNVLFLILFFLFPLYLSKEFHLFRINFCFLSISYNLYVSFKYLFQTYSIVFSTIIIGTNYHFLALLVFTVKLTFLCSS